MIRPRLRPRTVLVALLAALGASCRPDAAADPEPAAAPAVAPADAVEPAPVEFNEVAAIALDEDHVWLATPGGIVVLHPRSRTARIFEGDASVSHAGATDVAIAADGTAWTSHGAREGQRRDPKAEATGASGPAPAPPVLPGPRRGGVRAFAPSGSQVAFFAEHGLGTDDIASVAAGRVLVAAAAGPAVAILRLDVPVQRFELRLTESPRRLQVVDLAAGGASRRVAEFRPRNERMTAIALDGDAVVAGSTDAIYRLDGADLARFAPACRARGAPPRQVLALSALPGGFAASLAVPGEDDAWFPGGLVIARELGRISTCAAPGFDVPDAPALDVAVDGNVVWLATYEGLVRIVGDDPELLDLPGVPREPATAVAPDGRGGCWVGTWGGGTWHVSGKTVETYRIERGGTVATTMTVL